MAIQVRKTGRKNAGLGPRVVPELAGRTPQHSSSSKTWESSPASYRITSKFLELAVLAIFNFGFPEDGYLSKSQAKPRTGSLEPLRISLRVPGTLHSEPFTDTQAGAG